jgi:hypothetical protein
MTRGILSRGQLGRRRMVAAAVPDRAEAEMAVNIAGLYKGT